MTALTISQLMIYPIKSLAGVALDVMPMDALGAQYDRRYMLVDAQGQFVTQRHYPEMALAQITACEGGWMIRLPHEEARFLPHEGRCEQACSVTVWRDTVQAFDQGDAWATGFSEWLGVPLRLVYLPTENVRRIDVDFCPEPRFVGFSDGFPLLLANAASLAAVNDVLSQPITMQRFRPNIVVHGAKAFAEDDWQSVITAQGQCLQLVKPCSRCVIPTIDPLTAIRQPAVWQALKKLRQAEDGNIYFGQNAIAQTMTALTVGQSLTVLPVS